MTDPKVSPQPAPDEAPAEAPVAVPEDSEPPQGDPVAADAAASDAPGAGGADVAPVEPAPEPEPAPDPVAVAEARAAEYLELAQRKQAEFENFRRRMQQQVAQSEDRGVARLAKELLPALDHLELALEAAEKHVGGEEWVKGIRLVQEEVHNALGRVGIQPFAPYGEPFDPNEHDAMAQAPAGDKEPGTVAEVYQAGYRINGAVLRPARVVVAQ
jgi:molecular chaperone GrpE